MKSMCAWLGVNRSSYYDWRSRPVSAAAKKRAERAQIVRFHFEDSDEVAGSRRIAAAMARAGQPASRDAVRSIMRENGWVGQRPRKRPPVTTVPAEDADQLTDKLQRDFTAEAPGLKLVGDITYVPTWEGWVYLAVVLDCFSKKVVGYAFARHMRTELIVEALAMANRNGHVRGGVTVFHSDRGSQGGFNRSSQHPRDIGGVRRWRQRTGRRRPATWLKGCVGSGVLIGRCDRRCVHRGVRTRRGWCSGSSGD